MENSFIDLIIRIKNGYMTHLVEIDSPYSKFKEELLKKLAALKFIEKYKTQGDKTKKLVITLFYPEDVPALTDVKVISRPGRRFYVSYKKLKRVRSGMGYAILSTPKGILTDQEAKKQRTGGELLFQIW